MKTQAIEYDPASPTIAAQGQTISYRASIKAVTADYTIGKKDHTILADATSAALTVNLSGESKGRVIVVKKIDSSTNAVTVDSAETLDGAGSIILRNQNQSVVLQRFQHPTTKVWTWHVISESTKSAPVINTSKGADIASATTPDIGAATGQFVDITGTTTITGFASAQAGVVRLVRFTGALTFTHNATSLILPTGANITTAAGDTAILISLGSGNWLCFAYNRKSGAALA